MDDNERAFPSLPTNYISIVDLQKRWQEQQQKKQLNEDFKREKEEPKYHNNLNKKSTTNTSDSVQNSQLQISNQLKSNGNPNSEKGKSFHKKFNHKTPSENVVDASKVTIVSEDKEIEDDDKIKKTKKYNKNNRMKKGKYDPTVKKDYQEKVIEDDQTVEIELKFKEVSLSGTKWNTRRSTAAIKGGKMVYLGYRRVDHRESNMKNGLVEQEKETPELCVERQNQVNVNWKSRGAVREANKLHGEVMLENKACVKEKYDNNGENKGSVIVDDQMAEIESKFKNVRVSGNNRRSRAAIKGPYMGYRRVNYRGFNLKNQVEENSLKQSSEGSKVHGDDEKVEENTVQESREEHGEQGLENAVSVEIEKTKIRKVHGLPKGKAVRIGREGERSVTVTESYERRRELRYGRSTAKVGPRKANRPYGEFVWVKRSDLNVQVLITQGV